MDLDFADIKPTVYNVAFITVAAVVGIVLLKYLTVRFHLPLGISELIHSV